MPPRVFKFTFVKNFSIFTNVCLPCLVGRRPAQEQFLEGKVKNKYRKFINES
ncbi:MAG: hypothetical protein U9M90_03770 [Patescibacteria group bacterium]|nr:hypothetical protein [Patescibacteria group bacterium]